MSVNISSSAISCVECQRRKQRCNRLFPCNHCSKRGVAHLCRFVAKTANKSESSTPDGQQRKSSRKRGLDSADDDGLLNETLYQDGDQAEFDASDVLNALGYMPHTHHLVLGNGNGPKVGKDPVAKEEGSAQSEELKAAMVSIPAKPYADCLVDNFLNGANHHFYPLYPPQFRTQYDGWWATPPDRVTPELTSLILRVCACSALYPMDSSVKERLESELGADAETFASRMHAAAEKLSASIPPGEGGLVHVQQLFLKAFWFKSAERWTEAWHAVGAATRATIEIGLHQDSLSEGMSEFDREMRRRLWGILYVWDFALGSMLSRPRLINHADCTFVSPTLALEVDPENPDQPSPYGHMKLHCKLALDMAAQLASVSNKAISTEVALRLRNVVQQYFKDLPRVYALRNPDTSWDKEHGWIVFQHRYLHLMGYMSLFDHLKPYITRNSAKLMTDVEKTLRAVGVEAALSLMDVSWTFFDNMASVGAKFHYAAFCIFDTATVLCLAFVYDEARNLPQRETVLEAIRKGLNMLEELRTASRTSASLCRILKGLLAKLPLSPKEKVLISAPKRGKSDNRSLERSGNQTTGSSSDFGSSPLRSESNQSAAASSISPTSGTISLGSSEVDAEGVKPWSGGGQSGCSSHSPVVSPDGLYDGPSGGLQSATADLVPVDQTEWPVLEVTDMNLLQDVNLAAFEETAMPTALQLWDWQGLGLDIPEFFGNHPPM